MADADAEVVLGWRATLTLRETPSGSDGTDGDAEVVLAWRAEATLQEEERSPRVERPPAAMARADGDAEVVRACRARVTGNVDLM